jgi:hypothetical protein
MIAREFAKIRSGRARPPGINPSDDFTMLELPLAAGR